MPENRILNIGHHSFTHMKSTRDIWPAAASLVFDWHNHCYWALQSQIIGSSYLTHVFPFHLLETSLWFKLLEHAWRVYSHGSTSLFPTKLNDSSESYYYLADQIKPKPHNTHDIWLYEEHNPGTFNFFFLLQVIGKKCMLWGEWIKLHISGQESHNTLTHWCVCARESKTSGTHLSLLNTALIRAQ